MKSHLLEFTLFDPGYPAVWRVQTKTEVWYVEAGESARIEELCAAWLEGGIE